MSKANAVPPVCRAPLVNKDHVVLLDPRVNADPRASEETLDSLDPQDPKVHAV